MDVATLSWQHYEDGDDAVDSFRYRKVDQDVMLQNIRNWTTVHKKPVLVGEYGIHTVSLSTSGDSFCISMDFNIFDNVFFLNYDQRKEACARTVRKKLELLTNSTLTLMR